MSSVKELNDIMEQSRLKKKEAGLNTKTIRLKQSQWEAGKSNKGRKHSEETKKIWSEIKVGHKRSKASVQKSIEGTKETRWQQTLNMVSQQDILNAQVKHGNHQTNAFKELGISFYVGKKLCKHYGIELKKSNYEKTEFARIKQSEPILVWKCSKQKPFRPIGKPKIYYSVSECCRSFEPKLHKGNMLRNMNNGTPYRDMFFQKK
jgi:hypothetical protein